MKTRKMVEWNM